MVKKTEGNVQTLTSEEVALMRKEIAELRAQVKAQKIEPFEEIRRASVKGMANNSQISIRHFSDHKKVSLYHTNGYLIGKKVGPLHPGLLQYTFEKFKNAGIVLSVNCPTPEEIAEYKQTDEYKALAARQKVLKPHRDRPETQADIRKLAEAMTKLANLPQVETKPTGA